MWKPYRIDNHIHLWPPLVNLPQKHVAVVIRRIFGINSCGYGLAEVICERLEFEEGVAFPAVVEGPVPLEESRCGVYYSWAASGEHCFELVMIVPKKKASFRGSDGRPLLSFKGGVRGVRSVKSLGNRGAHGCAAPACLGTIEVSSHTGVV